MWRFTIKFLAALIASLVGGCATQHNTFADGTLLLLEAPYVLTRDQIVTGDLGPDNQDPKLYQRLLAQGWHNQDLTDRSVVAIRHFYYWNNQMSGIMHEVLIATPVAMGVAVEPGNIVEIEVRGGYGKVMRVRHKNMKAGNCSYKNASRGALVMLDVINPIGGPGRATLECPGLESEGWNKPGLLWQKLPESTSDSK